jgi:hypothetical protein
MATPQIYWLDANVLIEAKNGPYQFDLAPTFWSGLAKQANAGRIRVPKMVYEEIVGDAPRDDLAKWLKLRKADGFCVNPSKEVQTSFQKVADHVVSKFDSPYSFEFLKVADPWIIAHALESKGVVVTFEAKSLGAGRVKIPNVCADLGVPRMNLYAMIRALGIKLSN